MDSGILLINKPVGISTFDCIRIFKRVTGFKGKVGHAGTLDVFASGLVILLIGNRTKDFDQFQGGEKEYIASARLGVATHTLDIEGDITTQQNFVKPQKEEIIKTMLSFVGEHDQTVPSFSAAKFEGKPLYEYARIGTMINDKSKNVKIHELELTAYKFPIVSFRAVCSSGTYIRQLSWDIFHKLNIDSFLFSLLRTKVGEYSLSDAKVLTDLTPETWTKYLI